MTIQRIVDLLIRSLGADISKYDDSFLNTSLQKRIAETCSGSIAGYCGVLERNISERTAFIDSLQISYSDFFRNPLTYAVLERMVLPSLVLNKKTSTQKEIRIWSAACAGGQEAYTLAILLEELKNSADVQFRYRIFATDQSETQVHEAMDGQFTATALQNVSLKRVREWFTRQGDCYTIKAELQKNIAFSQFDLLNEAVSYPPASIFGDFDLVVCANLLFYYKNAYRNIILGKVNNSLGKNGLLVTGEAERNIVMRHDFIELYPQAALFRRNQP
jgi:chemotaxis methyl-accepting protein methylase